MAQVEQMNREEDDWEELSQPDETLSVVSEGETRGDVDNQQEYVKVDHPNKTSYPGRIYRNPKDEATGALPTLRKSLYKLKDILKDSIEQLEDFNQDASLQALSLSGPIMQAQQRQVDTLNVLLTNCAVDWDKSAAYGGMTFDEFADLDPVAVGELCRILGNFTEEVRSMKLDVQRRGPENVGRDVDEGEEEDVGWLDFILPAVDEVSTLLRVPEETTVEIEQHLHTENSGQIAQRTTAGTQQAAKTSVESTEKRTDDERVHEKMMMVSDW